MVLPLDFDSPPAPHPKVIDRRPVALNEHGIRLFAGRAHNHDYLWFSGYEISKLSATRPILHNYALTYALGNFSYWIGPGTLPRYEEDLAQIFLYALPALAESATYTRVTYNAVNSLTLRTDDAPRGINSPDLGYRTYLDPVWDNGDVRFPNGFQVYVFTFDGNSPRSVARLGKKGAAVRFRWEEIPAPRAVFREEPTQPTHPINPLDVGGEVVAYDPIMLPPHLLLRIAYIRNDWFVFQERHRVHVPKRVLARASKEP
jgi:CRISPR-associated protein Csc1